MLGMFWLPALRRMGTRGMTFLMRSRGPIIFLGVDAGGGGARDRTGARGPLQGVASYAMG